jgi:SAM-dependent methyltransferase
MVSSVDFDRYAGQRQAVADIVNVEMAQAWDGAEGAYWADNAASYERTTRRLWRRLRELVPVADDERTIDIGCGNGAKTCDLARAAPSGSALGIDLSRPMLENARRRAAASGITNARFVHGDAQTYPFEPGGATLATSSFGCMFFADPVAAFRNIETGLSPGGRLALLAWRDLSRNEWMSAIREALAPDLPPPAPVGPRSWGDPDRVRGVLSAAGYADIELTSVDDMADLGADADAAYEFLNSDGFVRGALEQVEAGRREEGLARMRGVLESHATADGVLLPASAWLVTARLSGS